MLPPTNDEIEASNRAERILLVCLLVYAAVAIVTFGSAFHHSDGRAGDGRSVGHSGIKFMEGIGCAVAWPLYWSYRAFAPSTPPVAENPHAQQH